MRSVLIASVPIHGHVMPLVGLAAGLVERGVDVRFLTGSRFRGDVERTGARFVPLPASADYDDRDLATRFPGIERLRGLAQVRFFVQHVFCEPALDRLDTLRAELLREPADAILAEPTFAGAGLMAAERDRVPIVGVGVVPLTLPGRDLAPFGLGLPPLGGVLGRVRNTLLHGAVRTFLRPTFAVLDQLAADAARGTLASDDGAARGRDLDWFALADAVVQLSVPGFEYPRPDAPVPLHFLGPVHRASGGRGLPPWWGDLDALRPIVHVTQGTIANRDLRQLVRPTLDGLAGTDALVVVTTGGRPVHEVGPVPPNARVAEFLPYDLLLPRTDVFVTNGGYGGVHWALGHGVPIVVAGRTEDKMEVGARVAWSGAGVRLRTDTPSSRAVRRAVFQVLDDDRYSLAARELAGQIAAAPGVAGVLATIDRAVALRRRPGWWAPAWA